MKSGAKVQKEMEKNKLCSFPFHDYQKKRKLNYSFTSSNRVFD